MNELNIFTGIQNFLQIINDNWTTIIIIVGLINALAIRIRDYMSKTDEERIAIAKQQLKETMLKLVTEAEKDYLEWINAGSIKRSQVIERIFEMYPVLSKVTNQDELINWIDDMIDEALEIMREIFEENIVDAEDVTDIAE